MTWVRLDDSFPTHPKISRLSDAQFRYYVIALCYASRHLTDGLVIPEALPRTHPSVPVALVAAGLFEKTPNGLIIHDFLDFQRSRAEVLAIVEKRREAGRLGGRPRKQTENTLEANSLGKKSKRQSKTEPTSHPIPSHPSPTGNGEVISEGGAPGDLSGVLGRDPLGPSAPLEARAAAEKRRAGEEYFESVGGRGKVPQWFTASSYGPDSRNDERERLMLWEAGEDDAFTRHVAREAVPE